MNASSLDTQIPFPKVKTKYMLSTVASSILTITTSKTKLFNKNHLDVLSNTVKVYYRNRIWYIYKNETLFKFEKFNSIYAITFEYYIIYMLGLQVATHHTEYSCSSNKAKNKCL